tara:strand:+ start:5618 stop:6349 length:732 start_codon:yes stop_codon:yes gene_type:complete
MPVPAIFEKLAERMPDEAYKSVSMRGGFTSIDAYHIVEKLTDTFGLCGVGWGMTVKQWHKSDKVVAAEGCLWYRLPDISDNDERRDGNLYEVAAIGEGIVRAGNVAEAMKCAQTNMVSKASSFLGIGLSIYKGQHIDAPALSAGIEVEARPIRQSTLEAIMEASPAQIEAVTAGQKVTPEQLTEAEGKHVEQVLTFEDLVGRAEDGVARRDKWLAAQGKSSPGEVDMTSLRQVCKTLREGISQ